MAKMDYENLKIAWFDLETTGIKVEGGGILEVACILTDSKLKELDRFQEVTNPGKKALQDMVPYVKQMHTDNELLNEIQQPWVLSNEEIDERFSLFLQKHNEGDPLNVILAGNTLGALDIPFMRKFMPLSYQQLHYRYLDITCLRIASGVTLGHDTDFMKSMGHRALEDVEECIEEFKHVTRTIFKTD